MTRLERIQKAAEEIGKGVQFTDIDERFLPGISQLCIQFGQRRNAKAFVERMRAAGERMTYPTYSAGSKMKWRRVTTYEDQEGS